jgi:hypothetical protein
MYEKITALISIIAAVFASYLYLDSRHFGKDEAQDQYFEVERKLLNLDRDRNEKIRAYYEAKIDGGEDLDAYEQRRYQQILDELVFQQQKHITLESKR